MINSMNTAWWVRRWSELHPNKTAIIFEGNPISYLELHEKVQSACCWLQSLGIEKGDRAAVMLKNCPEFLELYLACSRLGIIFVPINFRSAAAELEYILKNCNPRLFVVGSEPMDTLKGLDFKETMPRMLLSSVGHRVTQKGVLNYDAESSSFSGQRPLLSPTTGPADPEEPHVIMYTSGTTGLPKGAVLSHRKTFFNCLNADIFFKMHFDDIMLIVLPLFHSGGLFIQASPTIYKGATIVLHSKFEPENVYEDIEYYKVTKFLGVPTIYKALVQCDSQKRGDLSSLSVCAGGGEKSTPELFEECSEAGLAFRQIMGQTETSILLWASEEDSFNKPGTVGRPVFHAEVNIVDKDGQSVAPGEIGEIAVRGSIMMKEYWQDPVMSEDTIQDGWLHTGDLARMDEEGYVYLIDRAKDMFISGGENVYPAQVERVLRDHEDIEDVAVVGVPDETWGEVGYAFVIPKPGTNPAPDDLIRFCDGRLARYKWPKKVLFAKDFPRTALGKVRKTELKREYLNREGSHL